jgi:hypothetical protein
MSADRNAPCPCGSGQKYKRCCMGRDLAAEGVRHRFGLQPAAAAGAPGVWQADLAPLAIRLGDDPDARPAVALVVESGQVLGVEILSSPPAEAAPVAGELERFLSDAARRVGAWPAHVQVRDPEVAEHLAAHLAPRDVRVTSHPHLAELDHALADLREHLDAGPDGAPASSPGSWAGWGLPRDVVAELFRAAAGFWRAAPWRWLPSDDPIRVLEGTSRPWLCTVMGNGGETFGVGLYAEEEDFLRMFDPDPSFRGMLGPVLSLTFDPARELPPRMRREVAAAGWEVASAEAYPVLIALNTPGGGLQRSMADDLVRVLRTVPLLVAQHRAMLDPDRVLAHPLEWRSPETGVWLRLEPGPESLALLAEAPAWEGPLFPCLPEGPGADPEAALTRPRDTRPLLKQELRAVARFVEALAAHGLSHATLLKHAQNANTFINALCGYLGVPLRAVSELELRSFLFELYPLKMRDSAGRTEAMPVSLTRFFEFLEVHEEIACPWAAGVLAERDRYRERQASFPGGTLGEPAVEAWRAEAALDLYARALIFEPEHPDGTEWEPAGSPVQGRLIAELLRRWLLWRDEVIRGGLTDPAAVRRAATARQKAWELAPHPELGGRSPMEAIQEERRAG